MEPCIVPTAILQALNHRDLGPRLLGGAEVGDLTDTRRQPARVYPRQDGEQWIVEPPGDVSCDDEGSTTFTGTTAMVVALTFAFERYGSVIHLSR